MCHQNFIWHNIMLSRSLVQDTDTPTHMKELSGREDFPYEDFRRATGTFDISSFYGLHKVEYWRCCKFRLYDTWWGLLQNCWYVQDLIVDAWYWAEGHMYMPPKLHMTQSYDLNISGPGSWYSNVNGEHYQVWRISHVSLSEGQHEYYTAVLYMGCIKWNIDDVVIKLKKTLYGQAESDFGVSI